MNFICNLHQHMINVKVFELTILLSFAMNMVTQIICLGIMEVGDWYYTVCLKKIFS